MAFTRHWHDNHAKVWETLVLPRLPAAKRRWLELGSFEGKSATWTLENAIRAGDELVCVDNWLNAEIEACFDSNIGAQAVKVKSRIEDYLVAAVFAGEKFDVIYIDGNHDAAAVLENAVLSWRLLKPGGVMIFDDYPYAHPMHCVGKVDPKPAIDAFLFAYGVEIILLHRGWQVIVERRKNVIKRW